MIRLFSLLVSVCFVVVGADATAGDPLIVAHRGLLRHAPENTLPAYALAIEHGADMIEIDLHLSQDEVVIVSHDAHLRFAVTTISGEHALWVIRDELFDFRIKCHVPSTSSLRPVTIW